MVYGLIQKGGLVLLIALFGLWTTLSSLKITEHATKDLYNALSVKYEIKQK